MITKQTTFILGAGASWPYGFPTGQELREIIIDNTLGRRLDGWQSKYNFYNFKEYYVRKFGDEFARSPISIDAFLERRPEFLTIGKISIALALIGKENPDELTKSGNGKWYSYLFSKILTPEVDSIKNNKLSIITFNYDRSLDYFLLDSLEHSFDLDPRSCIKELGLLMPIHIYGKLGDLPHVGQSSISYSGEIDQMNINVAINDNNLISEREREAEILLKIKNSLSISIL